MDKIEEKTPVDTRRHPVSMNSPEPVPRPEIKVEKVDISKNIKSYDRKVNRAKSYRLYDYNTIALDKKLDTRIATPSENLLDPTINVVGKFLGVDTHHEWSKYSDKLSTIVMWAKEKAKTDDIEKILTWLDKTSNNVPSFGMSNKKIDQLYLYARLQLNKK